MPAVLPGRHRLSGFTLVEMAMVLVIMGIFVTLGISAFSAQMNSAASSATRNRQGIIQDALIAYLRDYKRLPCPETRALGGDMPTGIESRQTVSAGVPDPTSLCVAYWGTLPYATLGLSKDVAMDGYDNFFTYFVSNAADTTEPDWTLTQAASVPGFSVGNSGRFAVVENGVAPTELARLAVVVIVSHGKNGEGSFSSKGTRTVMPAGADELMNAPALPTLPLAPAAWSAPPAVSPVLSLAKRDISDAFDDVLLVMRPGDLLGPLIKEGGLKSATAKIQEDLVKARDSAIAQFLSATATPKAACVPADAASVPDLQLDPWGTKINYTRVSTIQLSTAGSTPADLNTIALQIWSSGPDRTSGNADDVFLPTGNNLTYAHIRSLIAINACP
jgi:prepilin-type N-terminal cleavage/methylation domain-containing protein